MRKTIGSIVSVGLCVLFLPGLLFADGEQEGKKKSKKVVSGEAMKAGLDHFYNERYEQADVKFNEYMTLEPDDPAGFLRDVNARILLLRAREKTDEAPSTEENRKEFQYLSYLVSAGIAKAENKIDWAEKNRDAENRDFYLYIQAYLYLGKAGIEWGNGHLNDACKSVRTAIEIARKSNYPDARFLEGMMNYLGGTRGWAVQHLILAPKGIPHDRKEGMRLICGSLKGNNGLYADDGRIFLFKTFIDPKIPADSRRKDQEVCRGVLSGVSEESLFGLLLKYPDNGLVLRYRGKQ